MKCKRLILTTVLLVCVVAVIAVAALFSEICYTVTVRNSTSQTLEGVRVFGGGCDESLGQILAGEEATARFWIQRDGQLVFQATSGMGAHHETIDGYVTSNWGGDLVVEIDAVGVVSVTDLRLDAKDQ